VSRRRSQRGPIWGEPAPGERKPRFSRAQIAEAALRIADREGFEAASMRRIAEELGAGTMTLYHYVRTRDDLIELMEDAIMEAVLLPANQIPKDWKAALRQLAMSSYRAFMAHPWALDALRGARFGPNSMRHFEQSLAAVSNAPFDLQGKLDALGIVDDYVFGHVLRVAEHLSSEDFVDNKPSKYVLKFVDQMLETGEFPHTAALLDGEGTAAAWARIAKFMNDAGRFVRGLEVLLDGLESKAKKKR
jgi:AcrR family transcriptional regulator